MIDGDNRVMGQQSWMKQQLPSCFDDSRKRGILYRPEIVNEIIAKVKENLSKPVSLGLFISGPQGIGKSHSIVNVIRKLQSTGDYLVTFVPDCGNWKTSDDLIEAICASIGTTSAATSIGIRKSGNDRGVVRQLIEDVAKGLKKVNKQWVFVFDQINRLFARFEPKKEIGLLDFPFYLIQQVMKTGRITSVMAVTPSTEIFCKLRHRAFQEYRHRIDMTNEEIQLAFSKVIVNEMQWTGNVPLYINMLRFKEKPKECLTATIYDSVELSLTKLLNQTRTVSYFRALFIDNMCQILLGQTFNPPSCYDSEYFVEVRNKARTEWSYRPLSPLVKDAATEFLWPDLMLHVVNKFFGEPNDTNFRTFQGLVVQRCVRKREWK